MEIFLHADTWVALLTLTILEIVLGIDNILFISIISNKLAQHQRARARTIGLMLALLLRIALLFAIATLVKSATTDWFVLGPFHASPRNIIMLLGGLFLVGKSTTEIHHKIGMAGDEEDEATKKKASMLSVILQIILMDLIFSFDSILTAVGISNNLPVMVLAVVVSLFIMVAFSGKISGFIAKHPSVEMLALSFLILIGFTLIMDAMGKEVEKEYIYFALAFSLAVEGINMRFRKKSQKKKA